MTTSSTTTGSDYRPPDATLADARPQVMLDIPARVVVKVLLIAALFSLALTAVHKLTTVLVQLAIAVFLAVAADPIVRRLERRGWTRGRAVGVVMLAAVMVVTIAASIFVPPLVEQGDKLARNAPQLLDSAKHSAIYRQLDERFNVVDKLSKEAAKLPGKVSSQLGTVLSTLASGVFGTITIVFLTVFLLLGGGEIATGIVRVFPKIAERRWWSIVQGGYVGIAAYVSGAFIIACIGGSVVALSAFLLGLPYALPLGLWMMLLEIIPMIGATIGAIPAIIVAFAAGGVVQGIVMIAIIIAYQQIENIVVQPRVQGKVASLSPFVVFLSVLIGANLLGILGALFAVPVAGVVQIFLRQLIHDQGSHQLEAPAVRPDEVPDPPDADGDGRPGLTGPDGTQI